MRQAKDYTERMNIRFTYAINGLQIYGIDMELGNEGDVSQFSSPVELWEKCFPTPVDAKKVEQAKWRERLFAIPFEDRGGANDESSWRAIMEHFSPAVQLGLTATPKKRDVKECGYL